MFRKRSQFILNLFIFVFALLAMRLFYIHLIDGPALAKAASTQRISRFELDGSRGDIVDRNLIPFTNRSTKVSVVLKPVQLKGKKNEIKRICDILGLDPVKTGEEIESDNVPAVVQIDETKKDAVMKLGIEGISFVNSLKRYDNNSIARHITGYLNRIDRVGEAGVEKSYDDILKADDGEYIGAITDAQKRLVRGLGYRILLPDQKTGKFNIKLTIDYHIQKIVENVMDENGITGAVVVENVYTGDIAAIASKPDFDQNGVENYLYSPKNELFNRAVASYNLGSIFKIIDVAAAFEFGGYVDRDYCCSGSIKIGDREFRCSSFEKGGHGIIGLVDAFALSCNPFFINLGIDIGSKKLLEMARLFGIGRRTGVDRQGIDEASGSLPAAKDVHTDGDTANISIGQGDIMATPLQVADIVATVANGGIKNQVNIVDSIVDMEGKKIRNIRVNKGNRIISYETADRIKSLMEAVTIAGTGIKANLDQYGGAGGKTGSAETGQYVNGQKVIHAWFAGYFPEKNPKYSISVFVENGKNGGQVAAPIFAQIAGKIMRKGY